MSASKYQYIFGPVVSRRLGRSLGIDLVPLKTCSFDCLFCQVGRTTDSTLERREYVPVDKVLAELKDWLEDGGETDYVTLSGSGEPTLHSRFDDILSESRKLSGKPSVLLSNGTLFYIPEVRESALNADIVKVSLSAWDQDSFTKINRPHPDLVFEDIVEGMKQFRSQYNGTLWLEVFALSGLNSAESEMSKIAAIAETISPDVVNLNTVVRPPAEDNAKPVPDCDLREFALLFKPEAEIVASQKIDDEGRNLGVADEQKILSILKRRSCTAEYIANTSGVQLAEVDACLKKLFADGQISEQQRDDGLYYSAF